MPRRRPDYAETIDPRDVAFQAEIVGRLKLARESSGKGHQKISQEEVGHALGMTKGAVSVLERLTFGEAQGVSLRTMSAWARVLKLQARVVLEPEGSTFAGDLEEASRDVAPERRELLLSVTRLFNELPVKLLESLVEEFGAEEEGEEPQAPPTLPAQRRKA